MSDLFDLSLPWWNFVIRALSVYIFLLFMLRVSGKRQIGQFSSFDFVLLLILSNAVQNSMNGGDNSLIGGLILAGTLVSFNTLMDYVGYKFPKFSRITEGTPDFLVLNGKPVEKTLRKETISDEELSALLREHEVTDLSEVKYAIIEANGQITVIKNK
ncbi:MAG: DUF421 domain-containing protein [Bdellovibrionales bacterium]|nr:DUF421 domain-containing protein [Bdellovibrionales bacterium]